MQNESAPKDEKDQKPETPQTDAKPVELTDEQAAAIAGGFVVKGGTPVTSTPNPSNPHGFTPY